MIDFILFILFSGLETYAMFFLAFKIFKIDIYHKEMVFASFIMGFFLIQLESTMSYFN